MLPCGMHDGIPPLGFVQCMLLGSSLKEEFYSSDNHVVDVA